MKLHYLVLFSLSACTLNPNSGNKGGSHDSLKKYSYYISGFTGTKHFQGTGFFIRYSKKSYFVTSKHLVASTDEACQPREMPLVWKIFLPDTINPKRFRTLSLDLTGLQRSLKCPFSPDLIYIEIGDTIKYKVSYIVPTRITPLETNTLDSLSIYGFPGFTGAISRNYPLFGGIQLISPSAKFSVVVNRGADMNNFDTIRSKDILVDDSVGGFRGSPVFTKDRTTQQWYFLGCWVAGSINENYFLIAPPSIIFSPNKIKDD